MSKEKKTKPGELLSQKRRHRRRQALWDAFAKLRKEEFAWVTWDCGEFGGWDGSLRGLRRLKLREPFFDEPLTVYNAFVNIGSKPRLAVLTEKDGLRCEIPGLKSFLIDYGDVVAVVEEGHERVN